jgi:plasmid replication initiation protein
MNLVPMTHYGIVELNIFFAICAKIRNQGTSKIKISFDEIKKISHYLSKDSTQFKNNLENLFDKIGKTIYVERTSSYVKKFVLFISYTLNFDFEFIELSTNPELEYILNKLISEFLHLNFKNLYLLGRNIQKLYIVF